LIIIVVTKESPKVQLFSSFLYRGTLKKEKNIKKENIYMCVVVCFDSKNGKRGAVRPPFLGNGDAG
jgi:hypothetical protein